ncbi:autotransporter-associated N-terminal domain-containing protein [Leptotrichia sp.]
MTNNLRKLKKDLCSFAKKCREFKYTDSALITFLITGGISISNNLFSSEVDKSIEAQKQTISTSIKDIHNQFTEARKENDKLLKKTNLELIQLMEQGDHVVKSPWSSWQYGANAFTNNWNGTYKGRGDKKEKYPYEGIFQRDSNKFNRYVSPISRNYGALSSSTVNPKSASSNNRIGLKTSYGIESSVKVEEPITSLELSAGIKPRMIDKQPLNITLGPVNAPNAPVLSISAPTPIAAAPPTIVPPTVTLNLPKPNTKPFNDFSFSARYGDYDSGGSTTAFLNKTEAAGRSYTLGVNPNNPDIDPDNLQTGDLNNKAYEVQGGVASPSGGKVVSAIWRINSKGGSCRYVSSPAACTTGITEGDENTAVVKGFTYGGFSATDPVKFYVAGDINDDGSNILAGKKGGIALHTVWNGTLHDIEGHLKGRAAMFSIETWHAPKLVFKNIKLDIEGNENTIFYLYPSSYYGVVQNSGDYNSFAQRGAFIGHVDANIKSQKNAIYSVMGLSGSFNITSTGTYKLEGGNNLVYSGLGYSPNFQNLIGQGGNIVDMYGTGMTPIINLKTAPESYGDGNVIMYFSDLLPDAAAGYSYTTIYNDGANRHDSWKKTKIGIHQGELKPSARIGEQLALNSSATTQTLTGNIGSGDNKYVENNVGILAQSGQRAGIIPSADLGAVDPTNNFAYVDKDKVHALYVNDIDVTFGKYSKGNIMIASERGTQIDVAMPTNSHTEAKNGIALRTDAIVDYNKNHASYKNDNKIISSTQDSSNEAAIGTIIGYAKGKWSDSSTRMGVPSSGVSGMSTATISALQNKPSEINFGVDVEMSAKYAEVNGTKFNPVAYVADGGKITAKNTKAYGYGSVIAYSKDGGDIAITGNIEAKDEWAASDAATALEKNKNIGAYADGNGSKVTVSGNATINGLGALAKGGEVEINGSGSVINTGDSAGIAAINGGTVKFGGGSINIGNNGVDNTTPFYADSTSKVNITGTTNINMSKGTILVGAASDYSATPGTTTRYNGMSNVHLTVTGDAKIVKNTVGGPTVTWTNSGSLATDVMSTTKFGSINADPSRYKAYYSDGTFVIAGNAQLGNATATDTFDNVNLVREKVTINPGVTVYSTTGTGLAMASSTTATSNADSGYDNQGTINITGSSLSKAATNVSYGTITNRGTINLDKGVGMYGTNGSKLENTSSGTINITDSGYGIVGMATGSSPQAYGKDVGATGKAVEIINDGAINVAGNNGIGIFADDNKGVALNEITVTSSKPLSLGDGGVGIAVTDSSNSGSGGIINVTGTGSSDIKVGANGIGIYAQNSTVNLNSNYGIETKDGGVGIYLTGNSTLPTSSTLEYKYSGSNTGRGMGIIYNVANSTNGTNVNLVNSTGTTGGLIGIFANGGGTFTNSGSITGSSTEKDFGIISENTDVNNSGNITLGNASNPNTPNIGIYAKTNNDITNSGNITVGDNAVGIYGYGVSNSGNITTGSQGTAIYSQGGNINLTSGTVSVGSNSGVGVYTAGNGQTVTAGAGSNMIIGADSFGFSNVGQGNHIISNINSVDLNDSSIYVYSRDNTGTVDNYTKLTAVGISGDNYGIYSAGTVNNHADMDLRNGIGNVGIYSINGGTAKNLGGTITVGDSDVPNSRYSIGMAAGYAGDATTPAYTGNIVNEGTINVKGKNSLGMYGTGAGTTVYNGTAVGSGATINLEGDGAMGIYLDEGAKGFNYGTITTVGSPKKAVGVVVRKNSEFTNYGNVIINSDEGYAFFRTTGGVIKNYGNFTVTGGAEKEFVPGGKATGKSVGGVQIVAAAGATEAQIIDPSGNIVNPTVVPKTTENIDAMTSSIGMYVDTLRGTNPINGLSAIKVQKADLIIGAEAAMNTQSKYIKVDQGILKPYNDAIAANPQITKWDIYSGSASWISTATIDQSTGEIGNVYLAKIPYTAFAGNEGTPVNSTDTYNFLDGLEQRYGVEALGTRENQLFQKLNGIGKNEKILFYQATDEMMGHQYGNVQQRVNETGSLLDKEFKYLRNDWRNPSKDNNKIKVFGMRNEYNTDTAGIIDYTSDAYGVAYVHENETVKLGNSSGWYAGAVNNNFKFKDIGKSRENQTMLKAGIFKTMSPYTDHNGSLRWTVAGDVFLGKNEMKRRFLVVDDIFSAKSDYTSYGAAFKTDLGYDIRMSERTHLRPYGALKMEYGKFSNIKEDNGEVRLEVKGNDYFSVKPEVGVEFKYVQPMAVRTNLSVGLTAAYENELGKVGDVNNEARVRYTNADWFGIRGEKEDRRGNGKFDLNIGVDNTRFGVTVNAGYDTKGNNVRGGIGFRAIY